MFSLNLPSFCPKLKEKDGKYSIYDPVRYKYVALTPEEWVRQHFVNYLISEKEYPRELVANEIAIKLNGTQKRCDTVVYDPFLHPLVIIEYKAPAVRIDQSVMDQILRYNMALQVKYLIISNGILHYCFELDMEKRKYTRKFEVPAFYSMKW